MEQTETLLKFIFAIHLFTYGASLNLPEFLDTTSCPSDFQHHPLIVLSMDGFRADYLEKGVTPTVEALYNRGVKSPFMKPSYPTITFPNHYTIVTGLLPPYHGIVANKFYDPDLKATFRIGRKESFQKRFWGGEPIWKTAENQGKIAAVYFWPGSEVKGLRPTYWFSYNESHPFNLRVDEVLRWLDLPPSQRPHLINFYLHEPDRQGHDHGPESLQVTNALKRVDDTLRYLLEGLEARNLLSCVNIIVLADHGMAAAGRERMIYLQDYIPNINNETRFWDGVFPRFERLDESLDRTQEMMKELSCRRPEMRVYHKHHLPMRWHLGAQRRVEDVVLDLDAGYQIDFDGTYEPDQGDHGYDNIFHLMNALFLAYGPAFKTGIEVESFQNIEVYNLMCVLLGVKPAPNNGTWGALHHLLTNPPPVHDWSHVRSPPFAKVPRSSSYLKARLNKESDESEEEDNSDDFLPSLLRAEVDLNSLLKTHLPWGIPQHDKNPITLLPHDDHITGYSEDLRLPVWVAFHLENPEGSESVDWVDDSRLAPNKLNNPNNDDHLNSSLSWQPLFHPDFSQNKWTRKLPFLFTNAVPLEKQLRQRWKQFRKLLSHWTEVYKGGVNVVMGTIFDYDFDTFADDLSRKRFSTDEIVVPTHLFVIVTRCLGARGVKCPNDWLDVNTFIFPQYLAVSNCMDFKSFAREFSAKLDDIERATGVHFFPHLNYIDRTRLKIRVHSNLWGLESWKNRIRSDAYGLKKR